jgi:hypothetical protein
MLTEQIVGADLSPIVEFRVRMAEIVIVSQLCHRTSSGRRILCREMGRSVSCDEVEAMWRDISDRYKTIVMLFEQIDRI